MTRTTFGQSRYVAGEFDGVFQRRRPRTHRPIIICHSYGGSAATMYDNAATRNFCAALGEYGTAIAADLGGQTWGNDTAITRVGQARDYLNANYGTTGDAILVGVSMGAAVALAYARAHPENVAAVAAITPIIDLSTMAAVGLGTELDAAYPPAYNDATDGPTHSPIQYAASLDADIDVALWAGDADTTALYAAVTAFVAARPATDLTTMPGQGHTPAAFALAAPGVVQFVADHA